MAKCGLSIVPALVPLILQQNHEDILRKEVSRLSSELQALSLAKDYEASEASVALNQKAELLANAKKRQERLEAEVEQETEAAAELERQVAISDGFILTAVH